MLTKLSKPKAIFALGLVFIGARMKTILNSNEFKYYGLIGGDMQIQGQILMACNVISPATTDKAKLLLAETIAVESKNGQATDYSSAYGEGLTQFDKPTFLDVQKYFSSSRYKELRTKIKTFLGVDILTAKYTDLRKSPMLSIVYARLLYYRVPYPIPSTQLGRWQYYKKWFNSVKGATTQAKYYTAQQYAVFKESSYNKVA